YGWIMCRFFRQINDIRDAHRNVSVREGGSGRKRPRNVAPCQARSPIRRRWKLVTKPTVSPRKERRTRSTVFGAVQSPHPVTGDAVDGEFTGQVFCRQSASPTS